MIKIENTEVLGWEAAIRGMRNPMNSWEKSDSWFYDSSEEGANYYCELNHTRESFEDMHCSDYPEDREEYLKRKKEYKAGFGCRDLIGPNDHKLMMNLAKAGSVDAKYRRMIVVYADITAPLYWWKEFDTYKIGTVANSCSTMHKIHSKEFTLEDFSCKHLSGIDIGQGVGSPIQELRNTIRMLNECRNLFLQTKDKYYWWQMIQLLPSSYNQRRTVMLNYEVLAGIYPKRKDHKLDEWHTYCDWIKSLPYSEIITLEE